MRSEEDTQKLSSPESPSENPSLFEQALEAPVWPPIIREEYPPTTLETITNELQTLKARYPLSQESQERIALLEKQRFALSRYILSMYLSPIVGNKFFDSRLFEQFCGMIQDIYDQPQNKEIEELLQYYMNEVAQQAGLKLSLNEVKKMYQEGFSKKVVVVRTI